MARSHQVTINGNSFPARPGELLLDDVSFAFSFAGMLAAADLTRVTWREHFQYADLGVALDTSHRRDHKPAFPRSSLSALVRLDRDSWTGRWRGCGLRRNRSALREICRVVS